MGPPAEVQPWPWLGSPSAGTRTAKPRPQLHAGPEGAQPTWGSLAGEAGGRLTCPASRRHRARSLTSVTLDDTLLLMGWPCHGHGHHRERSVALSGVGRPASSGRVSCGLDQHERPPAKRPGRPTKPPASCAEECGQTRRALAAPRVTWGGKVPFILFAQSQSKGGLVGDSGGSVWGRLVLELTLPFFSRQPVFQEVRTALPGVAIPCRRSSQQLQVTELKRQLSMSHWVAWGAEERTVLQTARVSPHSPQDPGSFLAPSSAGQGGPGRSCHCLSLVARHTHRSGLRGHSAG